MSIGILGKWENGRREGTDLSILKQFCKSLGGRGGDLRDKVIGLTRKTGHKNQWRESWTPFWGGFYQRDRRLGWRCAWRYSSAVGLFINHSSVGMNRTTLRTVAATNIISYLLAEIRTEWILNVRMEMMLPCAASLSYTIYTLSNRWKCGGAFNFWTSSVNVVQFMETIPKSYVGIMKKNKTKYLIGLMQFQKSV